MLTLPLMLRAISPQAPPVELTETPQESQQFARTADWPASSARTGTFPGKN